MDRRFSWPADAAMRARYAMRAPARRAARAPWLYIPGIPTRPYAAGPLLMLGRRHARAAGTRRRRAAGRWHAPHGASPLAVAAGNFRYAVGLLADATFTLEIGCFFLDDGVRYGLMLIVALILRATAAAVAVFSFYTNFCCSRAPRARFISFWSPCQ